MGQKVHPYGLRVGYIKPWKARWFAKRDAGVTLMEDLKIRKYLKEKLSFAGISSIEIDRSSNRLRLRIFAAKPGVIIGRRGQEIDKIKEDLAKLTKNEVFLDIKEVKMPQIDAQLVAENLALQLEKRIGFRRAMKKAVQLAMQKGALGIKIKCKGRLGGAEIAREEGYKEGKVPLSTFRADIDYGFAEAFTTYGTIGCKTWIYKGDILVKKEQEAQKLELEKKFMVIEEASKAEAAAVPAETAQSVEGKKENSDNAPAA
ncbi:MAG TPA: 30S ribosomal protein S3 [Candidatus Omnitrophota bacterium]|nr:30S ribosomal protein S3 [Candidatus Omnitrophota bacterium]HPS36184.1 30S ribosomal protein S3 [Candidatus Omnitrophota bacterium]